MILSLPRGSRKRSGEARFLRLFGLSVRCVLVLTVASCAAQPPSRPAAGAVGSGHLAPTFDAVRSHGGRPHQHRLRGSGRPGRPGTSAASAPTASSPLGPAGGEASPAPSASALPTRSASASLRDRLGDVAGAPVGTPSYVDLTGAHLESSRDGYVLRVSCAATLPDRQQDPDRTMDVASFFDVDGDGSVDFEVWAALGDDGWHGSYRFPDGARFGADSGVTARAAGHDLLIRFPRGHLGSARSFRWAVGSEWGSYEQVAAGSGAADHAPDTGAVAFPS